VGNEAARTTRTRAHGSQREAARTFIRSGLFPPGTLLPCKNCTRMLLAGAPIKPTWTVGGSGVWTLRMARRWSPFSPPRGRAAWSRSL